MKCTKSRRVRNFDFGGRVTFWFFTGLSRGFGFISYDTFEASDAALAGMNGLRSRTTEIFAACPIHRV